MNEIYWGKDLKIRCESTNTALLIVFINICFFLSTFDAKKRASFSPRWTWKVGENTVIVEEKVHLFSKKEKRYTAYIGLWHYSRHRNAPTDDSRKIRIYLSFVLTLKKSCSSQSFVKWNVRVCLIWNRKSDQFFFKYFCCGGLSIICQMYLTEISVYERDLQILPVFAVVGGLLTPPLRVWDSRLYDDFTSSCRNQTPHRPHHIIIL
jgi:hypothetical protein